MSERPLTAVTGIVFALATLATGCTGQSPTEPTATEAASTPSPTTRTLTVATPNTASSTQVRAPIAFTLSGCPNLPAGLTVFGSGNDFLVTNSRVDRDGVTFIERNDLVTGTATDSNGGSYRFNYHNHSNIEIPPGGFPWSFMTTDHFNLVGNGHADKLHVGFVARATFASPSDPPVIEFVNSHGNPFSCDPI